MAAGTARGWGRQPGSEHTRRELLRIVDLEDEGRSSARAGSRLIAHGPLRLVLLPGRGHVSALYDRRLKPAVADFLAEPA